MFSLGRIAKFAVLRRTCVRQSLFITRAITTSNKKDETTAIGQTTAPTEPITEPNKKRYFYDYGFDGKTEEEEHNRMNASFFIYVTMFVVCIGFYFCYRPETNLRDWSQREAYLELRRREQLGLPLIDPNYVDPSTVYIPSDEELGDTEIIV